MTELSPAVERELDAHDAFVRTDDGYDLETTVFDTRFAAEGERGGTFTVTVSLPTLSAAATDDVAAVVEDDWYQTFRRRLADVYSVAKAAPHDGPTLERDDDEVTVTLEYVPRDARGGVEDAKTLVEYVEGTYAQGLVPGYAYRGAAATLLENAQSRGAQPEGG